jgi:hypothetical protein
MNIYEKLLKIQTELNAPKNRRNSFGKYNYRSCEDILEAVKPLLLKNKASVFIQDSIMEMSGRVYVEANAYFIDTEKPEVPMITVTAYAREPLEKKGMDEPQITGTASSYARKYALNGLFLIDDVKDPDSDEYHNETEAKSKSTKKKDETDGSVMDSFINAEQCTTIEMLLKRADVAPDKFCAIYKIAVVPELPADKYADAVKKLETAVKAHKEDK